MPYSQAVVSLVTSPTEYFRERKDEPRRLLPTLVLALTGLSTLSAQLLLASMSVLGNRPTLTYVTAPVRLELPRITVAGAIISFGHVYLYWLVYAGVFYGLSRLFTDDTDVDRDSNSNRAGFSTVFWLTGIGFSPWVVSGAFWLGAMVISAQTTPPPETAAGNDIFVEQVQETALVEYSNYFDNLMTVWSLVLWSRLLKGVRGVTDLQSAVAVVPVAAF